MVGVSDTRAVAIRDFEVAGGDWMEMSGRLTTASWPNVSGCSGSEICAIKSDKMD